MGIEVKEERDSPCFFIIGKSFGLRDLHFDGFAGFFLKKWLIQLIAL